MREKRELTRRIDCKFGLNWRDAVSLTKRAGSILVMALPITIFVRLDVFIYRIDRNSPAGKV